MEWIIVLLLITVFWLVRRVLAKRKDHSAYFRDLLKKETITLYAIENEKMTTCKAIELDGDLYQKDESDSENRHGYGDLVITFRYNRIEPTSHYFNKIHHSWGKEKWGRTPEDAKNIYNQNQVDSMIE